MPRGGLVIASLVLAAACSRDRGEAPNEGTTSKVPPVKLESGFAPPPPAGASSFNLVAEATPVHPGDVAVVRVAVTPGVGYKLNPAYDTKLTIAPPAGLTANHAVQSATDATRNDTHELSFAVELTGAPAGTHRVTGTLQFAVCTADETACLPQTRPLDVAVAVR